jgi:hypothetical protein
MFRAYSGPSSGAQSARTRTQHDCHHDKKVKAEAATAVIELLMMGGKTPKTGRPHRPRTQHDCHHDKKVKPEAATVVIKLLMIGGKTPETC